MHGRPPEALLHDLWAHGLLAARPLRTTAGESVQILHPGEANPEAGPDFLDACLLIDGTRWYGAVELHIRSAEWTAHGHHRDPRYNSVILHVVLEADATTGRLRRADGTPLPELVLAPYLSRPLRELLYAFYRRPRLPLPCAPQWNAVPEAVRTSWLEALGWQRFRERAHNIRQRWQEVPPDQVLYELLLTALGYVPNAEPMRMLAERLPLAVLRTLPTAEDVEAALLGAAGLLEDLHPDRLPTSERCEMLRARFARLQPELNVAPMPTLLWQRGGLRPANRPERRLLQAATWLAPGGWLRQDPIARLEAALQQPQPLNALRRLLRPSGTRVAPGRQRLDILLLNAIVPFLLARNASLAPRLISLLQALPPERDRITRRFARPGYLPPDAFFFAGPSPALPKILPAIALSAVCDRTLSD
ncbi:DUF2851 family protein [Rhodothermus marinus]|uniref:DUF2851 family protein n=1 Tax=Rhodothermus marinus TaxID=29549 RepID=UPI000AEE93D8|nr:DUF2851 family protein [Rhodothermus marinus]